jgi:hypothetical protein
VTGSEGRIQKAALKASEAADQLLEWLWQQRAASPDEASGTPEAAARSGKDGSTASFPEARPIGAAVTLVSIANPAQGIGQDGVLPAPSSPVDTGAPLRLPDTDWLHHRLIVTGSTEEVANFRNAACGAGIIPWHINFDRMEEDLFHLLVAPPLPQRRRLSLAGARVLAEQLREAAASRHDAATARVGHSRACPLDLHSLVPVSPEVLQLGSDHPDALAWLWANWGTTAALRHVVVEPVPALRTPLPVGIATIQISFWSADWTPWRALAAVTARWAALRFDIHPTYGPL